MKIRESFVTNSSSTSYTIVLRDNAPKGYFSLFDLFKICFNRVSLEAIDEYGAIYFKSPKDNYNNESFKILDVCTYIESAKANIEWQEENIPEQEKQVSKYENLLNQPEDIISCFADTWDIKQGMTGFDSGKKRLNSDLNYYKKSLESAKKSLESDKKQLKVLEEFAGVKYDDLILLFIDIDNWTSIEINKLIEKSGATVLKKEVT